MSDKKKATRLGDCYEVAGRFMNDFGGVGVDIVLCHGAVTGTGELKGLKIGHAWIEVAHGAVVIDRSNGKNITVMARDYYRVGKIDPKKVKRYNLQETHENMLKYEHWGHWG